MHLHVALRLQGRSMGFFSKQWLVIKPKIIIGSKHTLGVLHGVHYLVNIPFWSLSHCEFGLFGQGLLPISSSPCKVFCAEEPRLMDTLLCTVLFVSTKSLLVFSLTLAGLMWIMVNMDNRHLNVNWKKCSHTKLTLFYGQQLSCAFVHTVHVHKVYVKIEYTIRKWKLSTGYLIHFITKYIK